MADTPEDKLDKLLSNSDRTMTSHHIINESDPIHPDPSLEYEKTTDDNPNWTHTIYQKDGSHQTYTLKNKPNS